MSYQNVFFGFCNKSIGFNKKEGKKSSGSIVIRVGLPQNWIFLKNRCF